MSRLKQAGLRVNYAFFRILNLARFYLECWCRSFPLLIPINHREREGHVRTLSQDAHDSLAPWRWLFLFQAKKWRRLGLLFFFLPFSSSSSFLRPAVFIAWFLITGRSRDEQRSSRWKKENYTGMRVYRLGTIRRCKGPRLIISKLRHADVQ